MNPFKSDDSPQTLDKSEALNLASEVLQDRDAQPINTQQMQQNIVRIAELTTNLVKSTDR